MVYDALLFPVSLHSFYLAALLTLPHALTLWAIQTGHRCLFEFYSIILLCWSAHLPAELLFMVQCSIAVSLLLNKGHINVLAMGHERMCLFCECWPCKSPKCPAKKKKHFIELLWGHVFGKCVCSWMPTGMSARSVALLHWGWRAWAAKQDVFKKNSRENSRSVLLHTVYWRAAGSGFLLQCDSHSVAVIYYLGRVRFCFMQIKPKWRKN